MLKNALIPLIIYLIFYYFTQPGYHLMKFFTLIMLATFSTSPTPCASSTLLTYSSPHSLSTQGNQQAQAAVLAAASIPTDPTNVLAGDAEQSIHFINLAYGALNPEGDFYKVNLEARMSEGFNCEVIDGRTGIFNFQKESAFAVLAWRDSKLFIAHRGAMFISDAYSSINMIPKKQGDGTTAHRGFAYISLSLNGQIQEFMKKHPEIEHVISSGHSLGGAIAVLTAMMLKRLNKNLKIHVPTFAAPRVYSFHSAKEAEKLIGPENFARIYFPRDPIPAIFSGTIFGTKHVDGGRKIALKARFWSWLAIHSLTEHKFIDDAIKAFNANPFKQEGLRSQMSRHARKLSKYIKSKAHYIWTALLFSYYIVCKSP